MRILIESLKRLYDAGNITKEKIQLMSALTNGEKKYILGE